MKKIIFLTICIIAIFIIIGQIQGIITLWHKQDVLIQTEKRLQAEKLENSKLKQQLIIVQNPDFVEKEARDKLFLSKPGEQQVVINKDLLGGNKPSQKIEDIEKPNWQQWISLFF